MADPSLPALPDDRSAAQAWSGRNARALAAVLLGVGLASLDIAIANTALPVISTDLNSTAATSIWILNAYQLAVVSSLLPFAALGDLIGPRRIFLAGLAFFTVASLGCVLATTLPALALARALQGIGAGGIMSVNVALIRMLFPAARLGRGVGLNALVVGVSFALGPTVASLVLAVASWPWLFGINVPLGMVAFVCALPALPKGTGSTHRFDPIAAVLTSVTFAALILALSDAAQREALPYVLIPLVTAAGAGTLLLRRQAGHPAPMLPVDLLRHRVFALSMVTGIASFTTQGLAFAALPFYFEQVLHRTAVDAGFLMTSWAAVVALVAPVAGRLSDRYPPGLLGGFGLAVLCIGMTSLALLSDTPQTIAIVARMALCGLGFGFFQSPNLRALMSSAPRERSGGASGMIAIARLLGQTSGAALVALCFGLIPGPRGSVSALALGATFAGLASIASFARLHAPSAS